MIPEELQRQLILYGIHCRVQREEVQIETCLYCGNARWNLELNAERGLYHCWACNKGGRLDALLRQHLGQEIYIPVSLGKQAPPPGLTAPRGFASVAPYSVIPCAKYLQRRRISVDTAKSYGLAVCTEVGHQLEGRLALPIHNFWTGKVVGYVGRSFTGKRPKYISTLASRFVAGYRAQSWHTPCVIVEGYFDGIALHRAGYHSVVLAGIAGGPLVQEFVARLPPEAPLVIMLDSGAYKQAHILQATLQPLRPQISVVALPTGRDPADFEPTVLNNVVEKIVARSLTPPSSTI